MTRFAQSAEREYAKITVANTTACNARRGCAVGSPGASKACRAPRPRPLPGPTAKRPRRSREDRRQVDGGLPGSGVERLMGRDLAHDQEGHAGLEIRPAADAEPEHQARGETFRARRARDQP